MQDNTHEVLLSAPLKGSMYTIRRLDMNCVRPEDSHGECRESGRLPCEGKACPGLTSQGSCLLSGPATACSTLDVASGTVTQAEVPVGHGSHLCSREPLSLQRFLASAATFSLSRLQSRSESLNGASCVITPLRWSPTCNGRRSTVYGSSSPWIHWLLVFLGLPKLFCLPPWLWIYDIH